MNCVRIPPSDSPSTPPTGAPAAKVAKAKERAREFGGKPCASMPSYKRILSAVTPLKWTCGENSDGGTYRGRDGGSGTDTLHATENVECN